MGRCDERGGRGRCDERGGRGRPFRVFDCPYFVVLFLLPPLVFLTVSRHIYRCTQKLSMPLPCLTLYLWCRPHHFTFDNSLFLPPFPPCPTLKKGGLTKLVQKKTVFDTAGQDQKVNALTTEITQDIQNINTLLQEADQFVQIQKGKQSNQQTSHSVQVKSQWVSLEDKGCRANFLRAGSSSTELERF